MSSAKPDDFFKFRVCDLTIDPAMVGICAGYENKEWRYDQLVRHLFEWLPEFALSPEEAASIGKHNMVAQLRVAAKAIYKSKKFKLRGEFGELILHAVVRHLFETIPVISKLYLKDSSNDTVKGFDLVHVIASGPNLELWLGEVKFYNDLKRAVRDVIAELCNHTESEYLKDELCAISRKMDKSFPHYDRLKNLFSPNTTLDEVFDALVIPVLLTYDSDIVNNHFEVSAAFEKLFLEEIQSGYESFGKSWNKAPKPHKVSIKLFLFPLKNKATLLKKLDEMLRVYQNI